MSRDFLLRVEALVLSGTESKVRLVGILGSKLTKRYKQCQAS